MLAALIRQAQHAGLVVEPGFAPKEIRWMANIHGGKLTGVIPVSEGKKGRTFTQSPEFSKPELDALSAIQKRRVGHFLAESCAVAAHLPDLDQNGNIKDEAAHQRNTQKHGAFIDLIHQAESHVPELREIVEVLKTPTQMDFLRQELTRQKAKTTDKLTFAIEVATSEGYRSIPILERDTWHDWWRGFRRETFARTSSATGGMLDFTTGASVTPANTHPKLTKLGVGAIAMGASLVGYDKEAFGSYGLEAGENGAVSEENAAAYRAALDSLLEKAPVLGQMKVAAWFDHRQAEGQALFDAIVEPASLAPVLDDLGWDDVDEQAEIMAAQTVAQREAVASERADQLLRAIRGGEEAPQLKAHYFALAISGASGRAMVRDWKTGKLEQLAQAVVTWFNDLAIVNLQGKRANRPKFFALLLNVQRPKSASTSLDDYLKPIRNLQLPLWRAAIDPKAPIPFTALAKVMEAHKAHVMTGKFSEALGREGESEEKGRVYIRMALIRAYHVRKARNQGGSPMSAAVDPNHPSPAYHCGRLMYMLANLQEAQGEDINAGVVQRYYGAASSTPALVLGRLTRLSQHHLAKLSREKPGLAHNLEEEIASVWAVLGKTPPKTLSLEEQSLFALGYYQQLAHNSATRREGAAQRKAANASAESNQQAAVQSLLNQGE